jgi:hypothetical protein
MIRHRLQGVVFGAGAVLVFSLIAWPILSGRYPFAGGFFIMALMIVVGATAAALIEALVSGAARGLVTGVAAVLVSAGAIFPHELVGDPVNIVIALLAAIAAGGIGTVLALLINLGARLVRHFRA